MSDCDTCGSDAFSLAGRTGMPMNVLAVIQHTSGEYLGLMEDHFEGRRIRFQYFRPFAGGGKLPALDLPADGLILLGGGPWGSAGGRDVPTLAEEINIARACLKQGIPVIGIGLGSQILAIAAGGGVRVNDLVFESSEVTRTCEDALNGYLPKKFTQVVYMRDWPVPPADARVLATDSAGRPALFQVGQNSFGFAGHPGIKSGMVEDLIMEFEEVPENTGPGLDRLRALQLKLEDDLVPIMTGLVQCTSLMSTPRAAAAVEAALDTHII